MPLERLYIRVQHVRKHFHAFVAWGLCEPAHSCVMMFKHIPLSLTLPFCLPPSSVLKSLPLYPSLVLPVLYSSPFLSSCCFIWLPDLSSLISGHPLHFDLSPHTAVLTTTKRRGLYSPFNYRSLFVSPMIYVFLKHLFISFLPHSFSFPINIFFFYLVLSL